MPMQPYTLDTSPEAHAAELAAIRRLPPAKRFARAQFLSDQARQMAFAAIRRQQPGISDEQLRLKFIAIAYGPRVAADLERWRNELRR